MKSAAVIQARMTSSRLPGKVMKVLSNELVIEHVINRLKRCSKISQIIVATSIDASDNILADWCQVNQIECYRGSLNDVLARYYEVAKIYNLHSIVRITADCPLIDPEIVDEVVTNFMNGDYDFYALAGDFPDGLDCSVFSMSALQKSYEEAAKLSEREHIGAYIENNPSTFKIGGLHKFKGQGLGGHRWTLDEPLDFKFLSIVCKALENKNKYFLSKDIITFLKDNPDIMKINSIIKRNEGYDLSLEQDET
jgi:spore coat polysaccharide biosynthesis protein SpsF (cytidylyltransferase family)